MGDMTYKSVGQVDLYMCHVVTHEEALLNDSELSIFISISKVYRHGDRSPTKTFPSDSYQEDAWPQGFGQLSTVRM